MTGGKLIKVCGMTDGDNIRAVEALGADMIGLIFYPRSPRCVREVPSYLPERAQRVGVFVDAGFDDIMRKRDGYGLGYVQLHGSESPELCRRLRAEGLRVVKAFGIDADGRALPRACFAYEDTCDFYLFDTSSKSYGGSGNTFDWGVLDRYDGKLPFFLSGGIGPEHIKELKLVEHKCFAGIDLNSRFEIKPGIKDEALLRDFLHGLDYILSLDK